MQKYKTHPWQELFFNRIEKRADGHWIWLGALDHASHRSRPTWSCRADKFGGSSETGLGKKAHIKNRSARSWACLAVHGELPYSTLYPSCGELLCVNPEHMSTSPDCHKKVSSKVERNAEVVTRYQAYLVAREVWGNAKRDMRGLARQFGVTRQRIQQIVADEGGHRSTDDAYDKKLRRVLEKMGSAP